MASFNAGTTFSDGVANDVTAIKLGTLVTNATPTPGFIQDRTVESIIATNDTLLIGDASDSNNLKSMTVANVMKAELTGTINSTTGTIATFNSTTGTIATLNSTTPTFLGAITASTNTINVGSGQIVKESSGNVGISVTPALFKLQVGGDIALTDTSSLHFATAGGTIRSSILGDSSQNLKFQTVGTEHLRIDSSGKVLVGTTSNDTGGRLEVKQASSETGIGIQSSGTDDSKLYFRTASGTYGGDILFNGSYVKVSSGTTERLRIDSSGNVGIGVTPSSGFRLTSKGATATSAGYNLLCQNSSGSTCLSARDDGLVTTGLLTNSPYNYTTGGAANAAIFSDGNLGRSTSSIKYKKDVVNTNHGLLEVMKLRPVTYRGRSENDGNTVFGGLIAEEVHDAGLTEFVQYADDGTPDALSYGNMVSLAFKAIQEQQAIIKELKNKVAALEAA